MLLFSQMLPLLRCANSALPLLKHCIYQFWYSTCELISCLFFTVLLSQFYYIFLIHRIHRRKYCCNNSGNSVSSVCMLSTVYMRKSIQNHIVNTEQMNRSMHVVLSMLQSIVIFLLLFSFYSIC